MRLPPLIAAIAAQRRFVGYTPDKCPINPHSGEAGRVNDPHTWGTYEQAQAWADCSRGGHVGVLTLGDLLVLDFDGAVHDGVIDPWVQERIEAIGGETELSLSGTGIHITVPMNDELRALLPHKVPIVDDALPVERVDLITGNNAVILGTLVRPAMRPLREQQSAAARVVQELLALPGAQRRRGRKRTTAPTGRPGRDEEIRFDCDLARAAIAHKCDRLYLAWLLIKSWDPAGTGYLLEAEVRERLASEMAATRQHPKKAVRRLVEQLVDRGFVQREPFKKTGQTVLRLPAPYRLAQLLETELGEPATMPRAQCLSRTPARWVYLGIIARRDGAADRPRPTSRAQRREMTLLGPVTQRKAERMAGVEVTQNWVVGSPPPGQPWQHLADGRMVYQISVSTQVHPEHDRERLGTHLVQRDDRRMYFYPELDYGEDAVPPGGLGFIGQQRLPNGTLVNLWEVR